MPYPNEHACRMRQPNTCQKGSFRRISSGDLDIIICRPKGKKSTSAQAYRYPKNDWTKTKAKAHCKKQGGTFHPAK